jgi:fatty acid desaturase
LSATAIDTQENVPSWRDALSREEIAALLRPNDWRSLWTLVATWLQIVACFTLVAVWPNPLTVIVAIVVLGTRQLGLAVVMHETAHRTLFSNRRWNDAIGQWLGAFPIWADCETYRPYHLQHHSKTGTDQDPDIGLTRPFPITRASMRRKLLRDLTGRTGIKFAKGSFKRTFGCWSKDSNARRAVIGVLVTNLTLFALLALAGHPGLYLLWAAAWLTTNTLVTRLRSIAEHALTEETPDPLRNTRTTLTRWWERFLIAPNRVNYHLEHHLLMTVPHYNLPKMHALLRDRGILEHAVVEQGGYFGVLKSATSKGA